MAAMAVPAVRCLRETPPPRSPETRVDIVTPATDSPESSALSPDGTRIVFSSNRAGASDLCQKLASVASSEERIVAYLSNESGRPEIYVRPFVPPGAAGRAATGAGTTGAQWQVSTTGGAVRAHPELDA